jgi:hypothetical protein
MHNRFSTMNRSSSSNQRRGKNGQGRPKGTPLRQNVRNRPADRINRRRDTRGSGITISRNGQGKVHGRQPFPKRRNDMFGRRQNTNFDVDIGRPALFVQRHTGWSQYHQTAIFVSSVTTCHRRRRRRRCHSLDTVGKQSGRPHMFDHVNGTFCCTAGGGSVLI